MLIESDSYEVLIEYILSNYLKEESVLEYLTGLKKLNVTEVNQGVDLFSEDLSIVKVDNVNIDFEDNIYWIEKLTADDKKVLKKKNIETVVLKKIDKSLLQRVLKELNFESKLNDFTSYYEILEEEYLFTLGKGYRKTVKSEQLLFMMSINDISKFYKKVTDDEIQLILSIIFSKAIKSNNEKIARSIMNIDKSIKTSMGRVSQKNIFGINLYK
jgi:hypothetical protein